MRTREEHLAWSRKRALEYLDEGDPAQAVASMLSDLAKHVAWDRQFVDMMLMLFMQDPSPENARKLIEGFH